jgi:hypothetical protein
LRRCLDRPEDLLSLLPAQLPRFKPGDAPLPGVPWQLLELLGVGGFGEVWKAHNPRFPALTVALKFCLDPAAQDRLLHHEAAVVERVLRHGKHPGIVELRQAYLDNDPPCLEYEYVAGGDLAGLVQERQGGLPPDNALGIVQRLAEIVAFAHQQQPPIVHRDLKPANILVQRTPAGKVRFKIADFGIGGVAGTLAVAPPGTVRGQLLTGMLRGSYPPLYASPQQMRDGPPDPRDDVHSPIRIDEFGAFNSGLGGFKRPIRVTLYNRDSGLPVIKFVFPTGTTGTVRNGSRFLPLPAPLDLPAGFRGSIVAEGYGPEEPNGNQGIQTPEFPDYATHDGGGLISFVGGGRYAWACEAFPNTLDAGPANRYGAGTFTFAAVPAGTAVAWPPGSTLPREIVNSLGMRLRLIPAGAFYMGSSDAEVDRAANEGPQHEVTLTRPFHLGAHAVTVGNFRAFVQETSYRTEAERDGEGAILWTGSEW